MPSQKEKRAAEKRRQLLAAITSALQTDANPLSAFKVLSMIRPKFPDMDLSEGEMERLLDEQSRQEESRIRRREQGNLTSYFLSDASKNVKVDNGEFSLYAPFCAMLKERGYRAKYLDHRTARKFDGGENHWRFPDVIAYAPAITDRPVSALANRTGAQNRGTLIAYELKVEILPGNIRASFFESLSNSFWANKRYVVAPAVDPSGLDVFRKLVKLYPVGLIEIVHGRLGEIQALKTLVECERSDLDISEIQELRADWKDFREFIESIEDLPV